MFDTVPEYPFPRPSPDDEAVQAAHDALEAMTDAEVDQATKVVPA